MKCSLSLVAGLLLFSEVRAQQSVNYFDFWTEGHWVSNITIFLEDTIPEKDLFIVNRLKEKQAFEEEWEIFIGDDQYVNAQVLRAYDQESEQWKLFYVDDENAQLWESNMVNGRLYFFKTFTYQSKTFYSRQSWSPYRKQSGTSDHRTICGSEGMGDEILATF